MDSQEARSADRYLALRELAVLALVAQAGLARGPQWATVRDSARDLIDNLYPQRERNDLGD